MTSRLWSTCSLYSCFSRLQVRRPNESPVFVSSTTGLGGLAKQLVKGYKSIHNIYDAVNAQQGSQPVKVVIGTATKEARLVDKVHAVEGVLRQEAELQDKALSIKLDDPLGESTPYTTLYEPSLSTDWTVVALLSSYVKQTPSSLCWQLPKSATPQGRSRHCCC